MTMPKQKPGRSNQDYETPDDFMDSVRSRFGHIGWDLAASKLNAKALLYYTEQDNALIQPWHKCGSFWLWCNPPFADISPWVKKAHEESQLGAKVLMLLPAGVGSNWFRDWVFHKAHVLFLSPRMTFKGQLDPYPKDLIICIFEAGILRSFECWKWKKTL